MSDTPSKCNWRVLNKDGTLNIHRAGDQGHKPQYSDLYHYFLSLSWPKFFSTILMSYVVVNLFFGTLYYLAGPNALEGVRKSSEAVRFLDSFFFSVQTVATIGYGRISPYGVWANILVTLEAFLGMLSLALVTGLFYARFSRPTARVIFSHNALITMHNHKRALLLRVANARLNQIVEAHMGVTFIKNENTQEGQNFRRLYDLKLQRSYSPIFALSWTAIHIIDETSPLYQMSLKDLKDQMAEFVVVISGTDDSIAQDVHARTSYIADEIVFDRQFKDIVSRNDQGQVQVDLKGIDDLL